MKTPSETEPLAGAKGESGNPPVSEERSHRKFATWLGLIALGEVIAAIALARLSLGVGAALAAAWFGWTAVATQVAAAAYLAQEPRIFGKSSAGGLPPLRWVLLFPFLLWLYVIRLVLNRTVGEDPYNQVTPRYILGRWVKASELPSDVERVIDLTCEFPRLAGLPANVEYWTVPTLDGCALQPADLSRLVRHALANPKTTYVHCAAGHGRSALVLQALLLAEDTQRSAQDVWQQMVAARPKIGLSADQRRAIIWWANEGRFELENAEESASAS